MNRLTRHADVLPLALIQEIKSTVQKIPEGRTNITAWDPSIVKDSPAVLITTLPKNLQTRIIHHVVGSTADLDLTTALYYRYTPGSHIPWHSDNNYDWAMSIYLNEHWDEDWSGYFAYSYQPGVVYAIPPQFNQAVRIYPPVRHAVFPTTSSAPFRESVQVFCRKPAVKQG